MLEMVASMEEVSRHTDTLWGSVEETASATHEMVSSINEVDQNVVYLTNFVTETSSSMVQMSASIAQVETNAARSYDLTMAVADAAESGMKAVRETIEGMEQIRQSVIGSNAVVSRLGERSVAIGRILNVIEDVAEQTNLLALNAAILAAQAGEYGKGFSVVAAEIRDLSERTASSTRDIGNLIGGVQDEVKNALKTMSDGSRLVEQGVSLSHEAGKALTKILDSATKASGMGKEIASATREQASGSETVTRAVGRLQEMVKQISSATQQQAAGSDHIMKAVESMREVTKYVRQAMVEQKSGSSMISTAAERMIEMIHEIFQVAANQAVGEREDRSHDGAGAHHRGEQQDVGGGDDRLDHAPERRHPQSRRRSAQVPRADVSDLRLITFRVGPEIFVLDIMAVRQILTYSGTTSVPSAPSFIEGIIVLRNEVIPIIDLRERFGRRHRRARTADGSHHRHRRWRDRTESRRSAAHHQCLPAIAAATAARDPRRSRRSSDRDHSAGRAGLPADRHRQHPHDRREVGASVGGLVLFHLRRHVRALIALEPVRAVPAP